MRTVKRRYNYYRVSFEGEATCWYRSPLALFRVGKKVIVPVSDNGTWAIGTVVERRKCRADELPYPFYQTKGIVEKAGWFAKSKVNRHNRRIETSPYPPCDISVGEVMTERGKVRYITCGKERRFARERLSGLNRKPVLIENYPPVRFRDIPPKVQERIRETEWQIREAYWRELEEKQRRKKEQFLADLAFLEEMEDLDQYN